MNWGYKIALLYGSFVAGILFLVIKSLGVNHELVTPDYYGQELVYGKQIEKLRNTGTLATTPTLTIENHEIVVNFPSELMALKPEGVVKVFKASDAAQDYTSVLNLLPNGTQKMAVPPKYYGKYTLTLDWTGGGKAYMQEFSVFVP